MIYRFKIQNLKFKVVLFLLFLTFNFYLLTSYDPTFAQNAKCAITTNPKADGLVSTPQLDSNFSTSTGACIDDLDRAAFVSFKLPNYAELKSLYYTQKKDNPALHIIKHTSVASLAQLGGDKIKLAGVDDHLYHFSNDLSIASADDINGNNLGIIFVDRNLTISRNQLGQNNSGLIFIVGGDVIIDQTVTRINGVIISSGTIYTGVPPGQSACQTSLVETSQLVINGSLVSLNPLKPIKFCRKLANNNNPAEIFNQQPKYLAILRNIFSDTLQKWSEITGPIYQIPPQEPSLSPTPSPTPTPSASPTITTLATTNVALNSATLNSAVNPNGNNIGIRYSYGTTNTGNCATFGNLVSQQGTIGSGYETINFSQNVTGLSASTTYYFCATAYIGTAITYGNILSFTTPAPPALIAKDTSSSCLAGTNTIFSWPHSISGNNRLLLVGVTSQNGTDGSQKLPDSVTYGGQDLTRINIVGNGYIVTELWYLVAPPTGTNNIVITYPTSTTASCGATSWMNVNQTTPLGTRVIYGATDVTSINKNITSAGDRVVHDFIGAKISSSAISVTPDTSQTQQWNNKISPVISAGSTKVGSGSVNMSWTFSDTSNVTFIGVPILPAN